MWRAAVLCWCLQVCPATGTKYDTMNKTEKHDLLCYLKQEMMKDGRYRHCCLPETKSCAVVSNSGGLRRQRFGRDIDSHDLVIRLNNAPIDGFESIVGRKRSFRVGWAANRHDGYETYTFCNSSSAWKREQKFMKKHSWARLHPVQCDVGKIGGVFQKLFPNYMGGHGSTGRVTTGAEALFLALSSCHSVIAYELVPSRHAVGSSFHYYGGDAGSAGPDSTGHKTWKAEHDLWARLSSTSPAEMHRGGRANLTGFPAVHCGEAKVTYPPITRPYYPNPWSNAKYDDWDSDLKAAKESVSYLVDRWVPLEEDEKDRQREMEGQTSSVSPCKGDDEFLASSQLPWVAMLPLALAFCTCRRSSKSQKKTQSFCVIISTTFGTLWVVMLFLPQITAVRDALLR